ncbi:MAG: hypothetical protein AAB156_01010, partial [Pseudomonadota bacterium]
MSKSFLATCVISTLTFCVAPVFAASADDWGVNLKAGTLGAGVELSKSLSDKFSASLGFNSYHYKTTDSASGIDYDYKLELQSASLLANY